MSETDEQRISSKLQFARSSGVPITCCYVGCEEAATVDVWRADSYFCDDHYLMNIAMIGCDLEGTAIAITPTGGNHAS